MNRLAVLTALAGLFAVQQEPLETLAANVRSELNAGRPLEAAKIVDEIQRRDPQWPGRRELVLETVAYLKPDDPQMCERGLELLRRYQRDFPNTDFPYYLSFNEAILHLLGHGFITLKNLHTPDPKARLIAATESRNNSGTRRVSTFHHYRLKDDDVAKVLTRMVTEGPDKAVSFLDVSRELWDQVGQVSYAGNEEPTFDLSRPGIHAIEEEYAGLFRLSFVSVSRFNLLVKRTGASVLAWAADLTTGAPVPGVTVSVRAAGKVRELKTGDDGITRLESPHVEAVVGRLGSEAHFQACVLSDREEEPEVRVYITTDRPIYRPGQTVRFKAVRRDLMNGRIVRPARARARILVNDPDGRLVDESAAEWNAEGSLSGSFTLGEEPRLGDYSVVVDGSPQPWKRVFTVAEYRKPEMQVGIDFPEGVPAVGGRVKARIRAEYYFGGPVAGAEVRWRAGRRGNSSLRAGPWRDEPRMEFYRSDDDHGIDLGNWVDDVADGEGKTAADGTLVVEFDAEKPEQYRSGPLTFAISAEVTDLSRYSAEGSATIEVDSSDLRIRVSSTVGYVAVGGRIAANVRITDRDGKPVAGQVAEFEAFTAPDGDEKEIEFESCFKGTAPTDADGRAFFSFSPDQAGRLRLRGRVRDGRGRPAEDRLDLPVAAEPAKDTVDYAISVIPERWVYEPGETAKFLVRLPRKGLTALLTLEGEGVHDARIVRFRNRMEILEIPLLPAFSPNVFVKLSAWKDGVSLSGGHEIGVLPTASFVDVEVAADRAAWRPRERGKVTVTTRVQGKPVAAEVELGIVDEPVFSLQADRSPDLRRFFLKPRNDDTVTVASGTYTNECDSFLGHGGPIAGALLALAEEAGGEGASVRRNFPDTMLWLGHVRTGEDGRAEVDVEMPDSLTTWRLTARAVSGDDRFGLGVSKTLCRKDVMVRLAAPRFFTERDRGFVAGIVHNERKEALEFRVRMEADGLDVEGGEKNVAVPPGGSARVEWAVKASRAGAARLRLFADSAGGSDAMELPVPVHPHGFEKVVGRTGILQGRWEAALEVPREALPDSVILDVSARSTGLSTVLDALPGLAGYPYGCVEQTMSRFLPSVVAVDALRRLKASRPKLEAELPKMVDAGLRRLYDFQHGDGGWGWWKEDATHPFMTAYVVYGLATARAAGVEIRKDILEAGADRLAKMTLTPFGAYALHAAGRPVDLAQLDPATDEERAWVVLAGFPGAARDLAKQPPDAPSGESIRAAAVVVRALAKVDRKDPRLARLVEWIMLQRTGDSWRSTLDTAHVVYALSGLVAAETPAAIRVTINGTPAALDNGRLRRKDLPPGPVAVLVEGSPEALTFCTATLRCRTREDDLKEVRGQIEVERRFERIVRKGDEETVEPLDAQSRLRAGEEVRVVVTVRPKVLQEYVMIDCPLPAGAEAREDQRGDWDGGRGPWYERREVRDDRVCVAAQRLDGEQVFIFRIRPTMPGEFHVMPARAFAMYDPDRQGSSSEFVLRVVP
jgi:alpha-2-macroglobulin